MAPDTTRHPLRLRQASRSPYIEPREVLRRYLSGRLDPAQARAFEQSVQGAPSELAKQLRLARELGRSEVTATVLEPSSVQRSHPHRAWSAFALLLASFVIWWAAGGAATTPRPQPIISPYEAPAGESVTVVSVPDHMAAWANAQSIPAVRLDPRAERLDLLPQLRTAEPVDWRLELTAAGGSPSWRADTLGSRRPTLSIPADEITAGDYELRVAHAPAGSGGERHLRIFRFEVWRPSL
ncbi:MAG: hypothetical protein AAGA68_04660 [Pseudomonadota bacterium]